MGMAANEGTSDVAVNVSPAAETIRIVSEFYSVNCETIDESALSRAERRRPIAMVSMSRASAFLCLAHNGASSSLTFLNISFHAGSH